MEVNKTNILAPKEIEDIFIERLAGYRNLQVEVREEDHPDLDVPVIRVIASWQVGNMAHRCDVILDNYIEHRNTIDVLIDETIKKHR